MGLDLPGNGSSETMYETKSQNVAENGAVNLPEGTIPKQSELNVHDGLSPTTCGTHQSLSWKLSMLDELV